MSVFVKPQSGIGMWEAPKPVGLGQRDRFPCNNTFALTVLLRAEIKAGKTFAAFCLPQSRAGGPKTGGTGTDGQMGAKPAHFQSGWRSRAVSNSRSNFTDFLNLRNRNIC